MSRFRRVLFDRMTGAVRVAAPTVALSVALAAPASAQSDAEQRWLLSWISPTCCVTNRCCFPVQSTDVRPTPNDQWLILASGEVIKRTDWSRDGTYWRCAYDNINGQWTVHPTALTRCLFVPMPNS